MATFYLHSHHHYRRSEKLNCLDSETEELLVDALNKFKDDEDAFVAIITDSGEKAFC